MLSDRSGVAKRLERIFDYIVEYKRANDGISPSYREISENALGQKNVGVVVRNYLIKLENAGRIEILRVDGRAQSRGIKLVGGEYLYQRELFE